jgi:hypothetical protein
MAIENLSAKSVLTGLSRCPHCGIAHPNMRQTGRTQIIEPADNNWRSFVWAVYCCETCAGGVLVRLDLHGVVEEIFPNPPEAHEDIPEPARRFLQQAMETLHAPDAAAVMAGSAVDAMLKHLKLTEGSLYSRIDKAVENHAITKAMGDWAHEVRLGSNRPRHADIESPHVSAEEAKQSVQFVEALAYFLFVLTARIERGTEAAKSASGT